MSRRKDIIALLASLLVASVIWLFHNLSDEFSAYLQFEVTAVTNLEGYAPEAVSRENLIIKGKADGFYILHQKWNSGDATPLELQLASRHFKPVEGEDCVFEVNVDEIHAEITSALGDRFDVAFLGTGKLTFEFTPQTYVKVPVRAVTSLTFKSQYMLSGDITLRPDSVLVYGPTALLEDIDEVKTGHIIQRELNRRVQGYISLEKLEGVRIEDQEVFYSIDVERYVEYTRMMDVKIVNAPSTRSLMLLPSQVEVTYRIPFGQHNEIGKDDISLEIDYGEYAGSVGSKLVPTLVTDKNVLSYEFDPKLVECIVVEKKWAAQE